MKTNPYFSTNTDEAAVYHNQRECPTGKQIPKERKKFGTNGYKPCKECAAIAKQ